MIRINLLPYREARKKERIIRQINIFLVAFCIVFVALLFYSIKLGNEIRNLNVNIKNTKTMLAQTESKAKRVDQIKKELEKLEHKTEVIKNIETNRRASVDLLESMSKLVAEKTPMSNPDVSEESSSKPVKRLWFTDFQANANNIRIQGIALDNKTIADFMSRLEKSNIYKDVNLKTIKQKKVENLYLKQFDIGCIRTSLKTSEEKNAIGSRQKQK